MKYVLMLASDFDFKEDLDDAVHAGCAGWSEEMQAAPAPTALRAAGSQGPPPAGGILLSGAGLRPASDATTVKVRGDDVLITDGPFAETKDQVGGLSLIECADLDEALELASQHPWAKVGQIEVRPVWEP